mmetsp:Transcript_12495/g.25953  ORF Transcript_12495/g.25953 Transcript_12495/m.25953 type:complete len:159 (-) Transcript_12495:280-756(-)|eukprot:CAMPEP_0183309240 /NCGR_PEP_ID=MMETSP0160_2-20130417/24631_1 /TAXON_ID=2839 ORGANISM="Odontella Sinensis, Strain Grunow 1884" /NCGR_SAMPLE_ID=MMETSP0160_2 /ASSEMBLY_ACC=CAM_ASM_000250 /LENGTH=158 /DNA_ID=CAMNT_0025473235 /DNA_START=72 /DNA_END=548 /DNA_ORIENTATION=+
MRLLFIAALVPMVAPFVPSTTPVRKEVKLSMATRRDVLLTGAAVLAGAATPAVAKQAGIGPDWGFIEDEVVPAQQAPSEKLDLNSAFVGDYKQFQGMFPTAAGKIASHGPYKQVSDIYKIEGLTDNDVKMFKKYQAKFTALPPHYRSFNERINARVST